MAASLRSYGGLEPAPGEFLDPSLLDPAVQTVPPPAAVPNGIGIPAEAFRLPTEPVPGGSIAAPREPAKGGLRGSTWLFLVVALLVVAGAGFAGWQLGVVERLEELAAPYLGDEIEVFEGAPEVSQGVAEQKPPPEPGDGETAEQAEATVERAEPESAGEARDGLAKLVIQSRPIGAFVSVDGRPAGRTPITLHLAPGTQVSLSARARGYLPKTREATAQAGGSTVSLALPALPYHLTVVSDPPGARAAAVGGGEITTPGEMQFKSMLSARTITISKNGFQTVSKNVSRWDFRAQSNRMVASMTVKLEPDVAPAEGPATEEPKAEASGKTDGEDTGPVEAEPPSEPFEAEAPEPPEPTETTAGDSP
jgi:hypothetical protein